MRVLLTSQRSRNEHSDISWMLARRGPVKQPPGIRMEKSCVIYLHCTHRYCAHGPSLMLYYGTPISDRQAPEIAARSISGPGPRLSRDLPFHSRGEQALGKTCCSPASLPVCLAGSRWTHSAYTVHTCKSRVSHPHFRGHEPRAVGSPKPARRNYAQPAASRLNVFDVIVGKGR